MDRIELNKKLDEFNISDKKYSLFGAIQPDTFILEWSFRWEIYYFDERGNTHKIASFNSESEACDFFLNMMIKNKSIEERMKNYIPDEKPIEEKRIFVVSNDGDTKVHKDV